MKYPIAIAWKTSNIKVTALITPAKEGAPLELNSKLVATI